MNKKLIALAVAGVTVAPAALAQTANPVTLSGRLHETIERIKESGGPSVTRIVDQASFLRVAGKEDLGGGLKAVFQFETAFETNEGSGTFASRNSGVGLEGGWGSLIVGRWDTPFKQYTGNLDPYGDVTIGGITAANNRGADNSSFDVRDANIVIYASPKFGGFTFKASTQTKDAVAGRHDTSIGLGYDSKMVDIIAAYEEHKDAPGDPKGYALGGRLSFGQFKFSLMGQQFKQDNISDKRKSWLGNIIWQAGPHELIYQYQTAKLGSPKCKVHQPGYHYYLSKRSRLSVQYAKVDNDPGMACGANSAGNGVSTAADHSGFSVGMRHLF